MSDVDELLREMESSAEGLMEYSAAMFLPNEQGQVHFARVLMESAAPLMKRAAAEMRRLLPATAPRTPDVSRPPWGVIGWQGGIVCYELIDDRQGGWIIEARLLGSETLMDVSLPLASAVFADAGKDGMTLGDLEGHRELRP